MRFFIFPCFIFYSFAALAQKQNIYFLKTDGRYVEVLDKLVVKVVLLIEPVDCAVQQHLFAFGQDAV